VSHPRIHTLLYRLTLPTLATVLLLLGPALPMNSSAASTPANSAGTAVFAVKLGSLATSESIVSLASCYEPHERLSVMCVVMLPLHPLCSPGSTNSGTMSFGITPARWPSANRWATAFLPTGPKSSVHLLTYIRMN
jgi:hypothetical protein